MSIADGASPGLTRASAGLSGDVLYLHEARARRLIRLNGKAPEVDSTPDGKGFIGAGALVLLLGAALSAWAVLIGLVWLLWRLFHP